MNSLRLLTLSGVAGLAIASLASAGSALAAPHAAAVPPAPVITHVDGASVEDVGAFGIVAITSDTPRFDASVGAAHGGGTLVVTHAKTGKTICTSSTATLRGILSCSPAQALPFGDTEVTARLTTSDGSTTSSPSKKVVATRPTAIPTITVDSYDSRTKTATVSGTGSAGADYVLRTAQNTSQSGTVDSAGAFTATVANIAPGSRISVRTTSNDYSSNASTLVPDSDDHETSAPEIASVTPTASGGLLVVVRISQAGTVQIVDGSGTPVTSASGTSNPSGGDITRSLPSVVPGATYTAAVTSQGTISTVDFTAPGQAVTPDPGNPGSPDPGAGALPTPDVSDIRIDNGLVLLTVTTHSAGSVQIVDSSGAVVRQAGDTSNPGGTTIRANFAPPVFGATYKAVVVDGSSKSPAREFTTPAKPEQLKVGFDLADFDATGRQVRVTGSSNNAVSYQLSIDRGPQGGVVQVRGALKAGESFSAQLTAARPGDRVVGVFSDGKGGVVKHVDVR